jgi:hypothetical protein
MQAAGSLTADLKEPWSLLDSSLRSGRTRSMSRSGSLAPEGRETEPAKILPVPRRFHGRERRPSGRGLMFSAEYSTLRVQSRVPFRFRKPHSSCGLTRRGGRSAHRGPRRVPLHWVWDGLGGPVWTDGDDR